MTSSVAALVMARAMQQVAADRGDPEMLADAIELALTDAIKLHLSDLPQTNARTVLRVPSNEGGFWNVRRQVCRGERIMDEDELKKKMEDEVGPWRMVRKKDAARRQILMACKCLLEGEWECAITLAGAAEGQLEEIEDAKVSSLFSSLKRGRSRSRFKSEREYVAFVNGVRDWLKHGGDQKDKFIYESEAGLMVGRAITKYWNAYRDNLEEIKIFEMWRTEMGYSFRSNLPKGALKRESERDAPE
jgi:hypothetical protein